MIATGCRTNEFLLEINFVVGQFVLCQSRLVWETLAAETFETSLNSRLGWHIIDNCFDSLWIDDLRLHQMQRVRIDFVGHALVLVEHVTLQEESLAQCALELTVLAVFECEVIVEVAQLFESNVRAVRAFESTNLVVNCDAMNAQACGACEQLIARLTLEFLSVVVGQV